MSFGRDTLGEWLGPGEGDTTPPFLGLPWARLDGAY